MHRVLAPWLCLTIFGSGLSAAELPAFDSKADITFPVCSAVVDISKPPYSAKGDGTTDDTATIQRALFDVMGQHKILYFPNGTYLISKPLVWSKKNSAKQDAWGFNFLQGQNTAKVIVRLKDKTFTDAKAPQAMMWCGGFGSADWFHNYIQNITFDVGNDNPGAVGLQFYSNNAGAVRDVAVVSPDGRGVIGFDVGHADMNGPLLVKNLRVQGFETGIRCAAVVNSQTFERIRLVGQTKVGLANLGQSISIRGLESSNDVPAVESQSFTVLIDGKLTSPNGAKAAIVVGKAPFLGRNITTVGYETAIASEGKSKGEVGPNIGEWIQGTASNPFDVPVRSLNLTVSETPEAPWDNPKTWAVVDKFGADPTGNKDSADAIQKAIDSWATTVFFPGAYTLKKPVKIRGKVRRLLGVGNWIDYNANSKPDFIVEDGEAKTVFIEHFAPINGGIEIATSRTVVLRSLETKKITCKKKGELFLEDVVTDAMQFNPGQRVWARQLNVENEGTHITNDGGALWVLGYKTERGGTLLHTKNSGTSEILGNFSYTTTAGKLGPMFRTDDATVFAFFNEVCYSGDPFRVFVEETRGKQSKTIKPGEGGLTPYVTGPEKK